jgi:hypothetical protein
MAPVHLAIPADPEAEPDDKEAEAQLCLEQVVADLAVLVNE